MRSRPISRLALVKILILCAALPLLGKLYVVQIVHGTEYAERAERQYLRPSGDTFNRGSIFFTNKDATLSAAATLRSGFTLGIVPKEIGDSGEVYKKLSGILALSEKAFLEKAAKQSDPYEELLRRVDVETAARIEALQLAGVALYREKWRFYPAGPLAAHVIGFVGYLGEALGGRYGLERYYDDTLSRGGGSLYSNFFAEIFSDVKRAIGGPSFEGDLVTSIEPTVERKLEDTLRAVGEKWQSRLSGGVIMNPATGEIYAMAAYPSFDPNSFNLEKNPRVFSNPIVESVFEMGSIVKPLTIASGIDAGVITPESTYLDEGTLTLNGSTIANFDRKGRGRVSMQEVLNQSLNTGAAYVMLRLGRERFAQYFKRFGLGEETGIDLPGEVAGLTKNLDSSRDIEGATASFGQGIATTPIATARALSALANGGKLPNPHVVTRIDYRLGVSKSIVPNESAPVVKPETAEVVTRMLVKVVDAALLGGAVKQAGYSIAAKTGTAQIARTEGKGYYEDRFLHSFFGYFPAYNPRFFLFLFTAEPKGVSFASHTLTYPFMDVVRFLINYYEIPPDR